MRECSKNMKLIDYFEDGSWGMFFVPGCSIHHQVPGVISENYCWVVMYPGYLHIKDSFLSVLWEVLTEYKHDKHLVGY